MSQYFPFWGFRFQDSGSLDDKRSGYSMMEVTKQSGPSIHEGHVAVSRRFDVSAPEKPKGKDPCPRESRNPNHRNPKMV
jgi:hypothetical protein